MKNVKSRIPASVIQKSPLMGCSISERVAPRQRDFSPFAALRKIVYWCFIMNDSFYPYHEFFMCKKISAIFLLLLIAYSSAFSGDNIDVKRVEPPSWWIGMNDPEVQLLVYGENISRTEPRVTIPGVTLKESKRVESANYLFLTLSVAAEAKPGSYPIEFMKDGKVAAQYVFQFSAREKNSSQRKSFDASDVVYLIMSDRFANGNPANDSAPDMYEKPDRGNPNGRHGGDIQGIIDHADYLQDLGVTAVWNTPLMEDNMERTSYHHYAITDYYRIDPRFGTNEEYRTLSAEVHKRKMKLIMYVVTNHCGLNYYWMNDLPTADWIHQFTEYTPSNKHISVTYDPYASLHDRNENVDGWFDHSMPDLNQDNPLVLKYLLENTIWWIEYAGVDGLRVDTYPYNSPQKIAEWSRAIRAEYPNLNIAGECWVGTVQETAYWQSGVKNVDGYDSQLPTVMDFPLHGDLAAAFNDDNGVNRLYAHYALDYIYANPLHLLTFTENHDLPRFNSTIKGDMRDRKSVV
jgi:hypothetical protein